MALTKITRGVIKANENYDTHNINSTGIITAVSANFTGNVSIGGTLTYQDVTNIDSVGIITAQAGVHVTGGHIDLVDNSRIRVGTGDDLQIFHDGSQNAINSFTSNPLNIISNGNTTIKTNNNDTMAVFKKDNAVELYYNNSKKFETTFAGTKNTGVIDCTGSILLLDQSGDDIGKLRIGTGQDLEIYHDGSNSRIKNTTGQLWLQSDNGIRFTDSGVNESMAAFYDNGAVELYYDGSKKFETTSGGVEVTGLLGVGVNSPATTLDVDGTLQLRASGNTSYATRIYSRLDSTHCSVIESYLNNSTAFEMMGSYADGGGGNPRVVIAAGGQKVGVGENNPSSSLHVAGSLTLENSSATGNAWTYYKNADRTWLVGVRGSSGDALSFYDLTSGTDTERLRIDSSGRLLMGTTTEGYDSADNFTVADSGNCGITIRSATNGLGTIAFSDATSGTGEYSGFIQYNQSNRHLTFGTESDDHVRIDNNGHLEIDYDGSNNARVQFGFASGVWITGNQSDGHQRFYTNSNVRILSGYNGQGTEFHNQNSVRPGADNGIGLGNGSYRWTSVHAVNGTIQTSDSRLKHEIENSVLGTDFIKALRPVSYKWIEGGKSPVVDSTDENGDNIYKLDGEENWEYVSRSGVRKHWGFVAQEVKQAIDAAGVDFGGWVLSDKDDPDSTQSLRYDQFIAPLTKALQEVIAKNEALEARIAALEG